MLKVKRKVFEKVIIRIISSTDKRKLIEEFSKDPVFFCSVLSDISRGKDSPNYHVLKKFTRNKEIIEQFVIEQAKSVLSYFAPDELKEGYYKVPNISHTASTEEIRKDQLNLTRTYPPDNTKKLNETYGALRDPIKRSRYNARHLSLLAGMKKPRRAEVISNKFIFSVLLAISILALGFYTTESGLLFGTTKEKRGFAKKVEETRPSIANITPTVFIKEPLFDKLEKKKEVDTSTIIEKSEKILTTQEAGGIPKEEKSKVTGPSSPKESKIIAAEEETKEAPKPKELKASKYVVKGGDNLWDIAKRFNVSVRSIKNANKLRSNKLDIGDVLVIPEAKLEEVVKKGAAKEEVKGKIFIRKQARAEEEPPQLELTPGDVKQVEAGAMWQNVPIFGGKEGAETTEQETAQKQSPQPEVASEGVKQRGIEQMRFQIWNSDGGILGSRDLK